MGASASGKSSVVLAGLAPRLHGMGRWLFTHFRIGTELDRDPFLALARALTPLYVTSADDVDRLSNTKTLAFKLQRGDLTLRDVFADCRSRNKGARILLIADQFEEAFTLVEDEAVRKRFIEVLLAGFPDLAAGKPDICLVLTLRADFYGQAMLHRALADALQGHVENLGPMTRAELRAAILKPAEKTGVRFEPGLVETLLDAVESKPGTLPLLQFALREMWPLQEKRTITRASYEAIGGVEGALAQRAEAVFEELTRDGSGEQIEKSFQRLFTRLVTLGEGQEDTRRVVEHRELGDEVWSLAQTLAGESNRLVVTNAVPGARETAEVVHEALIRHWPRLVQWVNRDRAFQTWLRQIRSHLDLWLVDLSDDAPLLRGSMLAQAKDWLARRSEELSDIERDYIEACLVLEKMAEAKEKAQRRTILATESRALTALSRVAFENHQPTDAVKLALAAWPKREGEDRPWLLPTLATLSYVLSNSILPKKEIYCNGRVEGALWSRDGSRILSLSQNTLRIWDSATGQPIGPVIRQDSGVVGALWSRDESRILSWSDDKALRLWDSATGQQIGPVIRQDSGIGGVQWSRDESRILMWSRGTLQVWDCNWPQGNLLEVACALLPNRDLSGITKVYGILIEDQICPPKSALPIPPWSQIEPIPAP